MSITTAPALITTGSIKTLKKKQSIRVDLINDNLLTGSPDFIRNSVGGFYSIEQNPITIEDALFNPVNNSNTQQPRFEIVSDAGIRGTNNQIHLSNYSVTSRISTSDPSFLNDQYWRNYAIDNFIINSVFFDHKTSLRLPVTKTEEALISNYLEAAEDTFIVSDYYKFYDRYQNNLRNVSSELILPNFYFLKSQGIADLDVAKMITLDGTLQEDYFDYVNFTEELLQEQPEIVAAISTGFLTPEAAARILFLTEVSDPEEGAVNTLFSNVASDKGVPRYSYNNIRDYLNVSYVNHTYQQSTIQRLETRLQNIIFLDPSVLNEHNDQLIATDFSFLKDDKKQAVYSLMPMSSHIRIDNEITNKAKTEFSSILEDNNYQGRLLKTLKEVFLDEVSIKSRELPFAVDRVSVTEANLKTVDLVEMLVYNYNNYISQTSNCFFFDLEVPEQKRLFDSIGEYRFDNTEKSANVLNASVQQVNKIFESQNMDVIGDANVLEMLELANVDKYNETIAYRVEKIGGLPTGDSRTENVLQNFWFYNTGDLIEYIDTQVKYGTDYTYKTYAYVIVVGNKYQYRDLAITRQIDIQKTETSYGTATNYCLEFYDPLTGQTTEQLLDLETNLADEFEVAFGRSQEAFEEFVNYINLRIRVEIASRIRSIDYSSVTTSSIYDGLDIVQAMEKALSLPDAFTYNALLALLISEMAGITDTATQNALPLAEALKETFGAFENVAATNAQIVSAIPNLADFRLVVEPSAKIVEVPIQEKTFKILDNPPNDIIATPHHLKDQSNRLAFFLSYDTFSVDEVTYPIVLTPQDNQNKTDYLTGNDLDEDDFIQDESVSMAEFFEVYRLSRKPTSYQDFENNLRKSINLRILKQGRIKLDAMFMEKVRPNQKYYYTFRAINENGIAGQFTPIFEAELINDGGYVYANFNQLLAEDLVMDNISEPLMSFKKLFNVVPNIQHLILDSAAVDFSKSAFEEVGNFKLGTAEEPLFSSDAEKGKTFKLRLTSKKTGKKIDLNITFNKTNG
jgi:hypothetical protein